MNGTVLVPRLSFAPTGSWAIWKSTETAPLTLAAGTNRVKLISIGSNGPNIDALTLNNAGVPPARPVFEAEQATLSGAVVSRNHPGYSGTGFADVINASGDYIEWTVQGRGNFDQTIYIRYANGSTSARTMRLTISGSNEQRMIEFAPTGSWSNWQTTFAEVTLLEGPVRVRLTAVGSSGPNIDWLQI